MSTAALLAIGDELVAGRVREGNFPTLIRALDAQGWRVAEARVIPDDKPALVATLHELCRRHSLVIATGGLGPTEDDLTADAVAAAAQVPRARHPLAEAMVRAFFAAAGRTPGEVNLRQADLPVGATPLANPRGTAPAFVMSLGPAQLLVLPGVPGEVLAIADTSLRDWLLAHPGPVSRRISRTLTVAGIPEAALGEQIRDLMLRTGPVLVGSYPGAGEVRLHCEADAEHAEELERVSALAAARLGEHLVSAEGESLEAVVLARLSARAAKLGIAESLTGGLVLARLISQAGASRCCRGGIVAYDDAAKMAMLGVAPELLELEGAVSECVARAMAEGVRRAWGVDFGLATTGVAGPGPDARGVAAGRVFVAVAGPAGTQSRSLLIPGAREDVRQRAASAALDLLRRTLA